MTLVFLALPETSAIAQSIQIRSLEVIRLEAPSAWTAPADGIQSARLLSGGDWITLSSTTVQPNPSDGTSQSRVILERRRSDGSQQWRIERLFTNVLGDEIRASHLEATPEGECRILVISNGHGVFRGSEIWSVNPRGELSGERREFQSLSRSIQILGDQLLVTRPLTFQSLPDTKILELRALTNNAVRSQIILQQYRSWGTVVELGTNLITFVDPESGAIDSVTATGATVGTITPVARTGSNVGDSFSFEIRAAIKTAAGRVYGGTLQSTAPNSASQSFGGADAWIGWFDERGNRLLDRSFGGIGSERLAGVVGTSDGGLLLAIQSSGSGVTGNKAIDGDGVWLVRVSRTGTLIGQALLPGHQFIRIDTVAEGTWILTEASGQILSTKVDTLSSVVVSVASPQPYDVQISDDLRTWKTIGTGVTGDLTLTQPVDRGTRFYRATPSSSN